MQMRWIGLVLVIMMSALDLDCLMWRCCGKEYRRYLDERWKVMQWLVISQYYILCSVSYPFA